jgi:hypothetical protein
VYITEAVNYDNPGNLTGSWGRKSKLAALAHFGRVEIVNSVLVN